MDFNKIPLEMRTYAQWVNWRYEDVESKKPTKVPYSPRSGVLANVNNPATWGTFDEACLAVNKNWYNGIGFVLTDNDPYAFIDLDDTLGDQAASDRQVKIYNEIESYAERSPSGKGLHIIVKAEIPSGRRRSFIEIYSSQRYMTMTGDVFRDRPIQPAHEHLTELYDAMSHGAVATKIYSGLEEQKEEDEIIFKRAIEATNGDKFSDLYRGNWMHMYPSQSEADFALIDIIAFYTQNRAQIIRMFRNSVLGERDKAQRLDYVNYMVNKSFDRMLPPIDLDGIKNKIAEALTERAKRLETTAPSKDTSFQSAHIADGPTFVPSRDVYSLPPGLVGEIAQYIYAQSPRPVPEIALAGALGLMSGIVGRAYNVSSTGLNQYILLLAPTGTGKESIAAGITRLMVEVQKAVPSAGEFMGPGEIASSQAILKYMSRGPTSFVTVVGEFGIYLQQMAADRAAPHMVSLRRFMLDAYTKSGEGQMFRPSIYSDNAKNTANVISPAFSIIGESTPERFYEGLHEGLISEGLLPRFMMIEYTGKRVSLNENHSNVRPSFELVDRVATVCANSLTLNSQNKSVAVRFTPHAQKMLNEFNVHCDDNINSSDREVRRHLWNRSHLKALKLAAVIAVGCNPYDPIIDEQMASWAINLVLSDVRNLLARFDSGEVGINNDETKQLAKIGDVVTKYLLASWPEIAKTAGDGFSKLHSDGIVPYSFVQRCCASVAVFKNDRLGSTNAIKRALKTLCERGDLQEMSRAVLSKDYDTTSLAYAIKNAKNFITNK